MMPKLDGWEMLERLRKKKRTPVLMLTARDSHNDRVKGLDTGADDYLVKPFDLSELLARLRALIRRSTNQTSSKINIRDVVLDTRARTATKAGIPVILTAREFAILEYLAIHRGEVVSRAELYEHLFDENDDTLSNLLDVHIFSIRKKLGAELIATRRGQAIASRKNDLQLHQVAAAPVDGNFAHPHPHRSGDRHLPHPPRRPAQAV